MRLSFWMIVLQIVGVVVGAVAVAIDVRTWIAAWPLLALTGGLIAASSSQNRLPTGLYFGLSAPTATVVCFGLMMAFMWEPEEAQVPLACILVLFAMIHTHLGGLAASELYAAAAQRPIRFQFSIASLLAFMLVISVSLGLGRGLAGARGTAIPVVLTTHAAIVGLVVRQFYRARRATGGDGTAARERIVSASSPPVPPRRPLFVRILRNPFCWIFVAIHALVVALMALRDPNGFLPLDFITLLFLWTPLWTIDFPALWAISWSPFDWDYFWEFAGVLLVAGSVQWYLIGLLFAAWTEWDKARTEPDEDWRARAGAKRLKNREQMT